MIPRPIRKLARTVLRTTQASGSYDDTGVWVEVESDPVSIRAVVQPATGTILKDLPEGVRDSVNKVMWTEAYVKEDDYIEHNGDIFRVVRVWDWSDYGGYYKAALTGVGE